MSANYKNVCKLMYIFLYFYSVINDIIHVKIPNEVLCKTRWVRMVQNDDKLCMLSFWIQYLIIILWLHFLLRVEMIKKSDQLDWIGFMLIIIIRIEPDLSGWLSDLISFKDKKCKIIELDRLIYLVTKISILNNFLY
ncbi:unnamed protein product [Musa textilis]